MRRNGRPCDCVFRHALRALLAALVAGGLSGCPILPATYVAEPVRDLPREQRAVLHGAFRDYVFWYWQVTFVEVDRGPIENWVESASQLELAPGHHRVVAWWEAFMGLGGTSSRRCAVDLELAAGHDYHVLRVEGALDKDEQPTLVIEDRAPGGEHVTLRLPCTGD